MKGQDKHLSKGLIVVLALILGCAQNKMLCWASENNTLEALRPEIPHEAAVRSQASQAIGFVRAPMRLEGKAEIQQYTNITEWQASQAYRQGVAALSMGNLSLAANYFQQAGDGFAMFAGDGKFQAEARFAEAQANRLMKQNANAAKLFAYAAELFRQYDPASPFLKSARAYLSHTPSAALHGKVSQLEPKWQALPAMKDMVDRTIILKGRVTQLEDGTKIAALKDNDFFNGGLRRLLPEAAAVDVSDAYVHKTLYKAFVDMNCLEFADLGGNYYTAPESYKAFKSAGKTVAIGASDQFWSPIIHLTIHGRPYGICMDLPGMSSASHNVLLVTDGQHVLAIDPRTNNTWKLTATFSRRTPDFNWIRLTHTK